MYPFTFSINLVMQNLVAQNNNIATIPGNLEQLEVLNVSKNRLSNFSVAKMKHLKQLVAGSNTMENMPLGVCNLSNLQVCICQTASNIPILPFFISGIKPFLRCQAAAVLDMCLKDHEEHDIIIIMINYNHPITSAPCLYTGSNLQKTSRSETAYTLKTPCIISVQSYSSVASVASTSMRSHSIEMSTNTFLTA